MKNFSKQELNQLNLYSSIHINPTDVAGKDLGDALAYPETYRRIARDLESHLKSWEKYPVDFKYGKPGEKTYPYCKPSYLTDYENNMQALKYLLEKTYKLAIVAQTEKETGQINRGE
jgi:hypothetical protein